MVKKVIKGVWSWLYSSGGSKELWVWTFINTSWTLQYASEGVLFSRLLEGLIGRSLYLRMLGKGLQLKPSPCYSLLSVVSNIFEKLVNKILVDHIEKWDLFSDFQYGSRSSRSTADLLTVVFDRIARTFNRSETTRAVTLDISKAFERVWYAVFLHRHDDVIYSIAIYAADTTLYTKCD